MFTGLIEDVGRLAGRARTGDAGQLVVETTLPLDEIRLGDSIAVSGVCLTVNGVEPTRRTLEFHTLAETLDRTNLGARPVGSSVNLERALRVGDRLGGHLVQGHVDATAMILGVGRNGADMALRVQLPQTLEKLVIPKGSIAIEGISLTIARLDLDAFECRIIPHTWNATNLGGLRAGDFVNLEADMVGKYILRQAPGETPARGEVTPEILRNAGFG